MNLDNKNRPSPQVPEYETEVSGFITEEIKTLRVGAYYADEDATRVAGAFFTLSYKMTDFPEEGDDAEILETALIPAEALDSLIAKLIQIRDKTKQPETS